MPYDTSKKQRPLQSEHFGFKYEPEMGSTMENSEDRFKSFLSKDNLHFLSQVRNPISQGQLHYKRGVRNKLSKQEKLLINQIKAHITDQTNSGPRRAQFASSDIRGARNQRN